MSRLESAHAARKAAYGVVAAASDAARALRQRLPDDAPERALADEELRSARRILERLETP